MLISIGVCFSFADTSKVDMNSNSEILASSVSQTRGIVEIGYCTGDGVKFKSAPNANSTTLGLIYKGETLYLQNSPAGTPSSWVYVYRVKTKQYGYMAAQYYATSVRPK